MWTFIRRHRRVLDFIKAHIAMPCEAIIVTSSPNPYTVYSLQKEVSASGNPQSVLCVLAVSGPCCPQSLARLFGALHHCRFDPTQRYFTGILGNQQPWQRVDNHWQEITGRGVWSLWLSLYNQMSYRSHRGCRVEGTVHHDGADFAEFMMIRIHSWGWLPGHKPENRDLELKSKQAHSQFPTSSS